MTNKSFEKCQAFKLNLSRGQSETVFCFPETLTVPRGEAEGNFEVDGKPNSLFPAGPVIKCFVEPPN